jgi:antitoxin HigA-1
MKGEIMIPSHRQPTHPGEILLHEFLKPMKMSQITLAQKLGVSLQRVNTLINGKRDISAETAVLLAQVFKTSPEFWMNLQVACDLYDAKRRLSHAA